MNAKWRRAHSPDHHQLTDLPVKLVDVTMRSDWQSPLVFGLAPLAWLLCDRRQRRSALWLGLYLGWLFASWWAVTHRIDRFWLPLLPVASVLGSSSAVLMAGGFQRALGWLLLPLILFNFGFSTSALSGYNAYRVDLEAARERTGQQTAPIVMAANQLLSAQFQAGERPRVLCVGEAQVFDAGFDPIYNTVFDVSIFEEWCGQPGWEGSHAERPLADREQIAARFSEHHVQLVLVNWAEILRYRTSYRYTDFVTPQRFERLIDMGILGPAIPVRDFVRLRETLNPQELAEVEQWAPELFTTVQGHAVMKTAEIFPVLRPGPGAP